MDTLGATKNHDFHAFTPTVSNIRPTSRGSISIVDNLPTQELMQK